MPTKSTSRTSFLVPAGFRGTLQLYALLCLLTAAQTEGQIDF